MSLKKILNLRHSLLFRLTVQYAGIFAVSVFLIFSIIYYKIYTVAINEMDDEFLHEISEFSAVMDKDGLKGITSMISEVSALEDPNDEFYRVVAFEGDVLASTDVSGWDTLRLYKVPESILIGKADHVIETVHIQSLGLKARVASAIISKNTVFQMGETLKESEEYLQVFINWFLFLSVIVVILSALNGWYMARKAIQDMEQVTQTAIEISNGAYNKRVQVKDRFIEIKKLGDTFNGMLDQIHFLLRSMREVNDNIAHDLRSPLARIHGIAEMGLMSEKTSDEYREMLVSTLEECDSLIDIINTMLEITEIEAGTGESHLEEVNISRLVLNACELFRPIAEQKGITINTNVPEELKILADRKKLQRIVSNLLDNAIKYTSNGGSVAVMVSLNDDGVTITFEDTGIGISEVDMPHIFKRFYRCDRSRSQQGVGLGLSLANALTASLNGSISIESTVNQGSKFIIHFPETVLSGKSISSN